MKNYKNKIIFIAASLILLSAMIGAMVFLININKRSQAGLTTEVDFLSTTESQPEDKQPSAVQPAEETPQTMTMKTDYFTLILPQTWEKSSEGDNLPLTVVDAGREVTNVKAKEINFKTNLSINSTSLGSTSLKDYIESVKTNLIQSISIIDIVKEEKTFINESEASLLEIKSIQQDLNFHTLLAFVAGKDSTVWAFSYNTLEESWPVYGSVFRQIIKSIKME